MVTLFAIDLAFGCSYKRFISSPSKSIQSNLKITNWNANSPWISMLLELLIIHCSIIRRAICVGCQSFRVSFEFDCSAYYEWPVPVCVGGWWVRNVTSQWKLVPKRCVFVFWWVLTWTTTLSVVVCKDSAIFCCYPNKLWWASRLKIHVFGCCSRNHHHLK